MPSDFSKKTNGISDSGSPKSHVYESNLITRAGHAVTTASTVSQARQAIIEETFDLLLSDLGLPDGSGWEVVEALREKSAIPAVARRQDSPSTSSSLSPPSCCASCWCALPLPTEGQRGRRRGW